MFKLLLITLSLMSTGCSVVTSKLGLDNMKDEDAWNFSSLYLTNRASNNPTVKQVNYFSFKNMPYLYVEPYVQESNGDIFVDVEIISLYPDKLRSELLTRSLSSTIRYSKNMQIKGLTFLPPCQTSCASVLSINKNNKEKSSISDSLSNLVKEIELKKDEFKFTPNLNSEEKNYIVVSKTYYTFTPNEVAALFRVIKLVDNKIKNINTIDPESIEKSLFIPNLFENNSLM
jgi:hypothetical protein